jgi:hypothetical protein
VRGIEDELAEVKGHLQRSMEDEISSDERITDLRLELSVEKTKVDLVTKHVYSAHAKKSQLSIYIVLATEIR